MLDIQGNNVVIVHADLLLILTAVAPRATLRTIGKQKSRTLAPYDAENSFPPNNYIRVNKCSKLTIETLEQRVKYVLS